jgi:hypothetical protein
VDNSHFVLVAIGIAVGLFVGLVLLLELGRRLGLMDIDRHGADARVGVGVVDGSVYGLLALLVGFSFSGAANRFDGRRAIVAQEVNMIGTAWQRLDLLPAESQGVIRDGFRRYVDAVLASRTEPVMGAAALLEPAPVTRAVNDVWTRAVAVCLTPNGEAARMLVLPALNDMFGVVESERLARRIHPPTLIWVMLGLTAFAAALFAGYGVASKSTRNWLYMIGVAATISVAVYVIIELEYPRLGLVRIDEMDRALSELRAGMR